MNFEVLKEKVKNIESPYYELIEEIGSTLWTYAEISKEEYYSAYFLTKKLETLGFSVERSIAGFPTGFIATWKQGEGPVLGLTCEYDALPGLSTIKEGEPGHGCGHNLFAAGAIATAKLVKDIMEKENIEGCIKVLGTPAEENYGSKPFYIKQGFTEGIDAFMSFHALPWNGVFYKKHNAAITKIYRFYGTAAHAGVAPHEGRSALDGLEIMNVAVNYLREHVTPDVRMHYVITHGGESIGVVPDYACATYGLRAQEIETLLDVEKRVENISIGAAMATETRVESETHMTLMNTVLNRSYSEIAQKYVDYIGLPAFDEEDERKVRELGFKNGFQKYIPPLPEQEGSIGGSTDEADLSWSAPWVRLAFAAIAEKTKGHSKEEVVQSNWPAAHKAVLQTVKASALTLIELLTLPESLKKIKVEHKKKMKNRSYPYEKDKFPNPWNMPNARGVWQEENALWIDLKETVLLQDETELKIIGHLDKKDVFETFIKKRGVLPVNMEEGKVLYLYWQKNDEEKRFLGYYKV